MSGTEERIAKVESAIEGIQDCLKTLVRLEEGHANFKETLGRQFSKIEEQDERIRRMETEMPTLKQASRWVFGAVSGVVGIVALAVIYLVVNTPK